MAQGSHTTFGGWESKVCAGCGRKVVLAHGGSWQFGFNHSTQTATSTCGECLPKARIVLELRRSGPEQ